MLSLVWSPHMDSGKYACNVCPAFAPCQVKHIPEHERSERHLMNLKREDAKKLEPPTNPLLGSSHRNPEAERVRGPLSDALLQLMTHPNRDFPRNSWVDEATGVVDWNSDIMDVDTQLQEPLSVRNTQFLTERLHAYLNTSNVDMDSDDEPDERSDVGSTSSSDSEDFRPARTTRRAVNLDNLGSEWFPWPDKETCVLDILRHIPRCSFSKKQNAAIHWGMLALGLRDLPSDRVMDDIDKALQPLCGIQSVRYAGKLGHVYYVNDLAAIIAQEMANPTVRDKLHFLPEDSKPSLSQAWQASRWLDELDSDLTTPMIRIRAQDFFIHEPVVLKDGSVCMPTRWFERGTETCAKVWKMREFMRGGVSGWIVDSQQSYDIKSSDLLLSFPDFVKVHSHRKLPDPRIIHGVQTSGNEFFPWKKTNAAEGNRWRRQANGHRVVAFPVWLYCDDTSGNTSKKWNKHNSFLFTAAGLPRKYVHQESNIHFLSTSNIAPPLEMLDGIIEQLQVCQERGIWAWDSHYKELVLVIPSVLAMLGDNPMQSEFACHIGFRGKLFCRACWVKGDPEKADEDDGDDGGNSDRGSVSDASSTGPAAGDNDGGKKKRGRKKKKLLSVGEMISRVRQFMSRGTARNRTETCEELRSQFESAKVVGGQAEFKRRKTNSGIKDTYQGVFLERIFDISTKRGRTKPKKQADIATLLRTFPPDITSPVWRIKDFDPHQDTPVEILHVILLGFVKYFWRDAVARLKKKEDKELLIARLSSFDVSGLGISPLSGHTLVNYSGSLTGRDFRAIVQAAPFILQGLLPEEKIHAWAALSAVVSLVWQPHIKHLDNYIANHFLDCTCRLTLNWFNKPKFHVILHLPAHIRRFGPAMLFATEGFESFNAIIRACSVHSNRHAPSHDIAVRMARGNRLRHLLSGGFFRKNVQPPTISRSRGEPNSMAQPAPQEPADTPWMKISLAELKGTIWVTAGKGALLLLDLNSFGSRLLGIQRLEQSPTPGTCQKRGAEKRWSATECARAGIPIPAIYGDRTSVYTPSIITLVNGDACAVGDSIVYDDVTATTGTYRRIGQVLEIVQIIGSPAEEAGKADLILVSRALVGEAHSLYCMRRVQATDEVQFVTVTDIQCTVNIQHNCADNKCRASRSKKIYQEREETSERALEVDHHSKTDRVLNTGQMRDAAILQAFCVRPQPLIRDDIIRAAAELEFEARKTKSAELALATTSSSATARSTQSSTSQNPTPSSSALSTSPAGPQMPQNRLSSLRHILHDDVEMTGP
ncbi:hypothetical protein B0H11DRAFT_2427303 [Mycena galericulata]|nr:hypothetical protein B0H11DRAFT_2427303 [Mycena galericulata]